MDVPFNIGNRAFGDDVSAAGSGIRTHFDEPVSHRQQLRVMIDQHHGVAVGNQVVHDTDQAGNIGRVKPDGRFIQDI